MVDDVKEKVEEFEKNKNHVLHSSLFLNTESKT